MFNLVSPNTTSAKVTQKASRAMFSLKNKLRSTFSKIPKQQAKEQPRYQLREKPSIIVTDAEGEEWEFIYHGHLYDDGPTNNRTMIEELEINRREHQDLLHSRRSTLGALTDTLGDASTRQDYHQLPTTPNDPSTSSTILYSVDTQLTPQTTYNMATYALLSSLRQKVASLLNPSPKPEPEMEPGIVISHDEVNDFDTTEPWEVVCFDQSTKRHMILPSDGNEQEEFQGLLKLKDDAKKTRKDPEPEK
ncbi:hypothetical protein FBEOM_1977 [Fusarium beomiforme]|uniref:Uncharacterized protein n=1 Tax=Fusarium beomiforme TaxID=44412 RepID=A0A9P5ASB8_9HYPO|nr:hypothetical protein FBEOM_1977 [Fusarium beomiforme]